MGVNEAIVHLHREVDLEIAGLRSRIQRLEALKMMFELEPLTTQDVHKKLDDIKAKLGEERKPEPQLFVRNFVEAAVRQAIADIGTEIFTVRKIVEMIPNPHGTKRLGSSVSRILTSMQEAGEILMVRRGSGRRGALYTGWIEGKSLEKLKEAFTCVPSADQPVPLEHPTEVHF